MKNNKSIFLTAVVMLSSAFFGNNAYSATCDISAADLIGASYGKTSGEVKSLKFIDESTFDATLVNANEEVKGSWSIEGTSIKLNASGSSVLNGMNYSIYCSDNVKLAKVLKGSNSANVKSTLYFESKK